MLACLAYSHFLALMFLMASLWLHLLEEGHCAIVIPQLVCGLLGRAICSVCQTSRMVDHGLDSTLSHNFELIPNSVQRLKSHVSTKALFCLISTVFIFDSFSFNPPFLFYNQILPFLCPENSLPLFKWQSYPLAMLLHLQVLSRCSHLPEFKSTCLFLCSVFLLVLPLSFFLGPEN